MELQPTPTGCTAETFGQRFFGAAVNPPLLGLPKSMLLKLLPGQLIVKTNENGQNLKCGLCFEPGDSSSSWRQFPMGIFRYTLTPSISPKVQPNAFQHIPTVPQVHRHWHRYVVPTYLAPPSILPSPDPSENFPLWFPGRFPFFGAKLRNNGPKNPMMTRWGWRNRDKTSSGWLGKVDSGDYFLQLVRQKWLKG